MKDEHMSDWVQLEERDITLRFTERSRGFKILGISYFANVFIALCQSVVCKATLK